MSVPSRNAGKISAIVPARNEEAVIGACVESLVGQAEIGEVLVVNDQSTDGTAAMVKEEREKFAKVRLLETNDLPKGWVGKNYAVSIGAGAAKGEWLLFTDADAVHGGDSGSTALSIAEAEKAVMVSFSPEQVMETWYEKALIPNVYCRLARKFSYADVNDPGKTEAAANGQFLMIRRDVYQKIGGHASAPGEVLDDVALAKRVKGAGHRIWFGSGKGIARVRMYRSFGGMWEGWKKNLYPLMGGRVADLARECALATAPVLAVFAVAILGFMFTESVGMALVLFVIGIVTMSAIYAEELKNNGFGARLALLGIPGRLLFATVLLASYSSHRRGKLEWKGREYPVGTPGASK
jgi:hypothetical protein